MFKNLDKIKIRTNDIYEKKHNINSSNDLQIIDLTNPAPVSLKSKQKDKTQVQINNLKKIKEFWDAYDYIENNYGKFKKNDIQHEFDKLAMSKPMLDGSVLMAGYTEGESQYELQVVIFDEKGKQIFGQRWLLHLDKKSVNK